MKRKYDKEIRVKQDFKYNGDLPELQGEVLFHEGEILDDVMIVSDMYLEAKSKTDGQYHLIAQFTKNDPRADFLFVRHFQIMSKRIVEVKKAN